MANYSGTKCPKCEKASFELISDEPSHSNYKFWYLRCSGCKTFLAMVPYTYTNMLVQKLIDHFKIQ